MPNPDQPGAAGNDFDAPRLSVTREARDGFTLITLSGQFVAITALTVEVHLARALTGHPPNIVLQADAVTAMDHTAATMLDAGAQVAGQHGGYLRLAAPAAPVCAAIQALPTAAVSMHRSVTDALQHRAAVLTGRSGEHRLLA